MRTAKPDTVQEFERLFGLLCRVLSTTINWVEMDFTLSDFLCGMPREISAVAFDFHKSAI